MSYIDSPEKAAKVKAWLQIPGNEGNEKAIADLEQWKATQADAKERQMDDEEAVTLYNSERPQEPLDEILDAKVPTDADPDVAAETVVAAANSVEFPNLEGLSREERHIAREEYTKKAMQAAVQSLPASTRFFAGMYDAFLDTVEGGEWVADAVLEALPEFSIPGTNISSRSVVGNNNVSPEEKQALAERALFEEASEGDWIEGAGNLAFGVSSIGRGALKAAGQKIAHAFNFGARREATRQAKNASIKKQASAKQRGSDWKEGATEFLTKVKDVDPKVVNTVMRSPKGKSYMETIKSGNVTEAWRNEAKAALFKLINKESKRVRKAEKIRAEAAAKGRTRVMDKAKLDADDAAFQQALREEVMGLGNTTKAAQMTARDLANTRMSREVQRGLNKAAVKRVQQEAVQGAGRRGVQGTIDKSQKALDEIDKLLGGM